MSYDSDNIFAKILRGEAPAFNVYETDQALAFMDVMPQVPGHTLVIPKDGAEGLHDVDPVILGSTIQAVQTVADAVKQAFEAPGIMIAQLNGPSVSATLAYPISKTRYISSTYYPVSPHGSAKLSICGDGNLVGDNQATALLHSLNALTLRFR